MRFMSMVKFNEAKLAPPPKRFLDAMDQLMQDAAKAGCVMVEAGGLLPTANGARVRLDGGKVTVTDGPFTEAKEVIGGYAIFEAELEGEHARMDAPLHRAAQGVSPGLGRRGRASAACRSGREAVRSGARGA